MFITYRRTNAQNIAESGLTAGEPPLVGQSITRPPRLSFLRQAQRRYKQEPLEWGMLGGTIPAESPGQLIGPQVPPRIRGVSPWLKRHYRQMDVFPALAQGETAGSPPFPVDLRIDQFRRRRLPPPRPARFNGFPLVVPPASPPTLTPLPQALHRGRRWHPAIFRRAWRQSNFFLFPVVEEGDYSGAQPIITGAGAPFAGGFGITSIGWLSANAISVAFASSYGSSYQYQLYAGRELIGNTTLPTDRTIVGQMQPSTYPQWLTILAVNAAQLSTNYGALLPPNPYNRVALRWSSSGMPVDAAFTEITSGTVPGGAVNLANVLKLVPFTGDRFYNYLTPPLGPSGTWNFQLAMRDDCPPGGNRGPAAAVSAVIIAIPPDVAPLANGNRLSVTCVAGAAVVTFAYP